MFVVSAARKYTVTDEKMKVLVKNGGAVDPASDLDEKTHSVCKENGIVYSCVLAKTDIQTGSNSFYKLQIIKEDKRSNYYLFRSWGRIGTTIGGNMCEEMEKEDAVSTFEFHFMDKSGNEWKDRERFVKKPSRYFIMELDYGPEVSQKRIQGNGQPNSVLAGSFRQVSNGRGYAAPHHIE